MYFKTNLHVFKVLTKWKFLEFCLVSESSGLMLEEILLRDSEELQSYAMSFTYFFPKMCTKPSAFLCSYSLFIALFIPLCASEVRCDKKKERLNFSLPAAVSHAILDCSHSTLLNIPVISQNVKFLYWVRANPETKIIDKVLEKWPNLVIQTSQITLLDSCILCNIL